MKLRYLLLCVAVGAVLGGGMIFLHTGPGIKGRPAASTPGSRNQQRTELLKQLQTALIQYKKEHGNLPVQLAATASQICTSYGAYCKQVHLTDLSFLTTQGDYIPTMPMDPLGGKGNWASGFFIQEIDGNITLTAPEAEDGKTIQLNFSL
jgi:type II secretory pathway pseudopilin PulG